MFSVANVSNTYHEQVITYHSFYSTQIVSKAMADKTSIVLTRLSISFEIGIKTENCLDCSCRYANYPVVCGSALFMMEYFIT